MKINNKLPFKALQFWLKLPKEIRNAEKHCKFDLIHFNGLSYWFFKKKVSSAYHLTTINHLVVDTVKNNNLGFLSRIKGVSNETNFFMPSIESRCIKNSDKIIAISEFTKRRIIEKYNITSEKIRVIYDGINLDGYKFSKDELERTKQELGLLNCNVIIFVGRVDDDRKGLDLLFKSLNKVIEQCDTKLLVVGKGDKNEAVKLAKSLNISDNVIFTGFVDDETLKKFYSLSDVYVCPSRLEGFGLTILEAMAVKIPVIATNVGSIPELIKDGYNGLLVEKDNINELSSTITKCLNQDTLIWDSEKRRKFIEKNFSWKKTAKETEILYNSLVNKDA